MKNILYFLFAVTSSTKYFSCWNNETKQQLGRSKEEEGKKKIKYSGVLGLLILGTLNVGSILVFTLKRWNVRLREFTEWMLVLSPLQEDWEAV